jgi:hypothetical protein
MPSRLHQNLLTAAALLLLLSLNAHAVLSPVNGAGGAAHEGKTLSVFVSAPLTLSRVGVGSASGRTDGIWYVV